MSRDDFLDNRSTDANQSRDTRAFTGYNTQPKHPQ